MKPNLSFISDLGFFHETHPMLPTALPRRPAKPVLDTLSVSTFLCAAGSLAGQTAPQPAAGAKPADEHTEIPEVVVEANAQVYNVERLQSPKYTEPLRNVPQTVTVVPKALIEDRGAFSLRDVLRNTPGITIQGGEGGGGGLPGDSISIRGFSARADWFQDGMRDYGGYNRDPFNTESVEIAKGPASSYAGRGATGGSVNIATKMASLKSDNLTTLSVGTDNLYRGTVDVNEALSDHIALRLNGLYHQADTPGRGDAAQERWGIAGSLAFGLGTDTRFTVNYQHFREDNMPDYGIPWVPANAVHPAMQGYQNAAPPRELFDKFYGNTALDYEHVQNDTFTGIFEHDFSDKVRLRNVTRYTRTHRESIITSPRFNSAANANPALSSRIQRNAQFQRMTNEVFANVTNITVDFDTGVLKHSLAAGLELSWERQLFMNDARANQSQTDLFNPNPGSSIGGTGASIALLGEGESHLDTVALYLFDTVKIGKHFEVNGGIRYDHIEGESRPLGGGTGFSNSDDLFSWKAGLVYKPVDYGSIYFGFATSFSPSIDSQPSGLALTAPLAGLDPEQTESFELGTKWDLLNKRLSISAALFHMAKTNVRTTNAGVTSLAGDQSVEGVEFGISGNITKNWQIFAGYAYMESNTNASSNLAEVGMPLGNVPEHSGNIWTTYTFWDKLQIGTGLQYLGDTLVSRSSATAGNGAYVAPEYWLWDAMVSYKFSEKFSLRLNIYNLSDERYVDRAGGVVNNFVPGQGRSAALTASIKF